MKDKKGFTLIELLIVVAIIGVISLMGLRLYSNQQDKAKIALLKANAGTVQTLIQSELADKMITHDEAALYVANNAGLKNPFNGSAMNTAEWFPEIADTPGEIQITLTAGIFSIQGYGADGLLPDILTAQR
ncbi:MAG: type II secretion system protein [Bacteroidales bacterium]|nr:type II secretion system protein [Bacteroidales bacterium]